MKYEVGDLVIISKEFSKENLGGWINCSPKLAKIIKIQDTPTNGPAYSLEVENKTLPVCYWKIDIDYAVTEDPDYLWMIWGDM